MKTSMFVSLLMTVITVMVTGCASVQRATPVAPAEIDINLTRGDVTIMGSVKGSSTLQTYAFGLVQIVDNDKWVLLGCWLFEDQYAFAKESEGYRRVSVEDRAYYKALAATPDADAVVRKAFVKQSSGIPFLAETEEATFIGKAIKFKTE